MLQGIVLLVSFPTIARAFQDPPVIPLPNQADEPNVRPLIDPPPVIPAGPGAGQAQFESDVGYNIPYSVHIVPREKQLEKEQFDELVEPQDVDFPSTLSAVFTSPAHFPKWGYSQCGKQVPLQGLLIYEGMTIAVGQRGEYELRCIVEAPLTPVVMNLQFVVSTQVEKPGTMESKYYQHPLGTITIPPVTVAAKEVEDFSRHDSLERHMRSRTFHIKVRGYSHILRKLNQESQQHQKWSITRKGNARFGSVPD
jgi:hypothetical protein